MLRIITGRAGTGKTARIMAEIAACGNDGGMSILAVPEQYSHEAERELCRVCGDGMSLFAEVLSFSRLARRINDEAGSKNGKTPALDKGGRLLCMALCLDAVGSRLSVYGGARRKAELQTALLSAVDELKSACVSPEALLNAAQLADRGLSQKLTDMALIMEGFDAVCQNAGATPAGALDTLAENLENAAFPPFPRIFIDGFTDFTAQEMRILRALLKCGVSMTVCLTCDESDRNQIFEPQLRTLRAMGEMAKELGLDAETLHMEGSRRAAPALAFFEGRMTVWSSDRFEDADGAISLFSCDSAAHECELAAARCLELVRLTGCRYRDIAVAVRGFDDYRPALESAFARYGVPLFTTRRSGVSEKPLPALISSVFEVISGGWDYDDVFTGLKTGLWGFDAENVDELENYVILWGLSGSAWTKEQDWQLHPRGFGEAFTDSDREALERINALRRRIAGPVSRLAEAGKKAATATGQVRALADFLEDISLAETLERRAGLLREKGTTELAAEYVQLWDIVVGAMEQAAAVLGDMELGQEEFARLFRTLMGQSSVAAIPVSVDCVSAGDMDRMRRRNIKHLILLGASDDRLPRAEENAAVFSPDERDRLLTCGIDIGGGGEGLYREMSLIYNCLTLPSETLFISCAARGADGSEKRPSFVMQNAARLFDKPIKAAALPEARLSAPGPAFELAASGKSPEAEAYFAEKGREAELSGLRRAARMLRGSLSDGSVRALYGQRPRLTASRADAFSSCRYSYFLQYGLKLKPREPAGFDAPQYGSFMHYVLENVAREAAELGGFKAVSKSETERLTDKYVEKYVHEELNDFHQRTERFIYLFRRLTQTVRRVAADMAAELAESDFQPLDFELSFSQAGDLPPAEFGQAEGQVFFTGVADRVDGWVHDGRLYLRVMDYKTGRKAFSLSDVCRGMGLQMLLYLFALEREGKARYGREIVPAGVLYIPARSATVSADGAISDEEADNARAKQLRRSGLLLDDPAVLAAMENSMKPKYIPVKYTKEGLPSGEALAGAEQLGRLAGYIDKTLTALAGELRRGSIAADPYYRSQAENACLYCGYADACQFIEGQDQRRYMNKLSAPEAWEKIEEQG